MNFVEHKQIEENGLNHLFMYIQLTKRVYLSIGFIENYGGSFEENIKLVMEDKDRLDEKIIKHRLNCYTKKGVFSWGKNFN